MNTSNFIRKYDLSKCTIGRAKMEAIEEHIHVALLFSDPNRADRPNRPTSAAIKTSVERIENVCSHVIR